jgi:hypothetical protein
MNNSQVAHAWAHGRSGKGSNLCSDGVTLTSYSTPIATIIQDVAFISSDSMSPSTSKHLSHARRAVDFQYFDTPFFQYGRRTIPTAEQCIIAAAEAMQGDFNELLRKRKPDVDRYEARRIEIIEMAAQFNVVVPDMPEVGDDLKEKAKAYQARERERAKERKIRDEERERAARIIAQGELDLWLQQGKGYFPGCYRERGNDRITIRDNKVITSQGAEAPLDHVIKALAFYDSRRSESGFTAYHTNGHKIHLGMFTLDEIKDGDVKAGCHYFKAEEIARFRAQWKDILNKGGN